jgi:hypothetical protein
LQSEYVLDARAGRVSVSVVVSSARVGFLRDGGAILVYHNLQTLYTGSTWLWQVSGLASLASGVKCA